MDNQCYFNGDFWQCAVGTDAGESPSTFPEKWRRVVIPAEWRRVLGRLTYAELLELDGQTDKANLHRSAGESQLDDLTREAARQELDSRHGSVHTPQGQAVAASVILNDAYRLMRWDPTDLENEEKADGLTGLSKALQQVWEAWWWESLMLMEQLSLRSPYVDGVFQSQGAEVYFPPNGKYYLAVQPSVSIPPASLTNGSYVLNGGFWAESSRCYTGADVDNTVANAWGTIVRNPHDGLFYQRGGSLQVTGTNADFANQNYQVHSTNSTQGRVIYWPGSAPSGDYVRATRFEYSNVWILLVVDNTPAIIAQYWDANDPQPGPFTPDLVSNWQVAPLQPGALPGPTITNSFVAPAPPDAGSWGLLTPFDPVLTIATKVRQVSWLNPDLTHNPQPLRFQPVNGGVRVLEWCHGLAWVWSRRATPILTGSDFDPETTYEATPQNDLVYDS